MKFEGNLPIYLQVADRIKKDIVNSNLLPGDKLPSTRELSVSFSINPNTAARVYKELEEQDLIFTIRGKGTFITLDEKVFKTLQNKMAHKVISNFLKEMYDMEYSNKQILEILRSNMED